MSLNGFVKDDQILLYQVAVPNERQDLEPEPMPNSTPSLTNAHLLIKDGFPSGKGVGDMKLDLSHNEDGGSTKPQVF